MYTQSDCSLQAEWCLPDHRFAISDYLDILAAARRLVSYTRSYPHLQLDFDPQAREAFDSYGVMFNRRSNTMRHDSDADVAAEEGIGWL